MREILFRGKKKSNGEWIYGDLSICDDCDPTIYDTQTGNRHFRVGSCVILETVGQYTGLTDMNGEKIFEGDIIKQIFSLKRAEREVLSVIEYGVEYAYSNVYGVCQRFKDGSGASLLSVFDKSGMVLCEVIGNIHDNRLEDFEDGK